MWAALLVVALHPGPPGRQPPPRPSARAAVAGVGRAAAGFTRGSEPVPPSASVGPAASSLTQAAEALGHARATERARVASKHEAMQMLRTARPDRRPGHIFSGIEVAAAGVMPFVHHREGVYFLMQELANGTRAGLLSDFGGRREDSDKDAYHTAARELSEETCGAFGDVHALAVRLRKESSIRILNKSGRYITFFLEVPYIHHTRILGFDNTTSEGGVARTCRWLRADQIIGEVERGRVFARLLQKPDPTRFRIGMGEQDPAADQTIGALVRSMPVPTGAGAEGPTSLHKAVLKTIVHEEAHPYARERWEATVLADIVAAAAAAAAFEDAQREREVALAAAAAAARPDGTRKRRRRPWRTGGWSKQRAGPPQFAP